MTSPRPQRDNPRDPTGKTLCPWIVRLNMSSTLFIKITVVYLFIKITVVYLNFILGGAGVNGLIFAGSSLPVSGEAHRVGL